MRVRFSVTLFFICALEVLLWVSPSWGFPSWDKTYLEKATGNYNNIPKNDIGQTSKLADNELEVNDKEKMEQRIRKEEMTALQKLELGGYKKVQTLPMDKDTMGCVLSGLPNVATPISSPHDPKKMRRPMPNDTCQATHPEYLKLACCDIYQTEQLADQMTLATMMFHRCPACQQNQWDFWCAYTCDPYQSRFVNVTATEPHGRFKLASAVTYTLHPDYAQRVYDSCQDVELDGGGVVHQWYATYQAFFQWMGDNNPVQSITFLYDETTGYNHDTELCNVSCSCQNCRSSCIAIDSFNSTLPHVWLLGMHPNFLAAILIGVFIFLLCAVFGLLAFRLPSIARREYSLSIKKTVLAWVVFGIICGLLLLTVMMMAIFEFGLGDQITPNCTIKMPGGEWSCWMVGLSVTVVILMLGFFIFVTAYFYFAIGIGKKANLLAESESATNLGLPVRGIFQRYFYHHGKIMARHALVVIPLCLVFTALCGVGMLRIVWLTDPVGLWVSPDSRAATDKAYFDEKFGPFYRVEQLIATSKANPGQPILEISVLKQLLSIHEEVVGIVAEYEGTNVTFDELCYKPIEGQGCEVATPLGWWQENWSKLLQTADVVAYAANCTTVCEERNIHHLLDPNCMDNIGAPVDPHIVLGNFSGLNYTEATAAVITFMLNNPPEKAAKAEAWEREFLKVASRNYSLVNLAYSAECSVQDELDREAAVDIPTVIGSYLLMFFYVSLALGELFPFNWHKVFINTRFILGVGGIVVVVSSLLISFGLSALMGIKATLIISEVIPFLVLAIGVDNIFILVSAYDSTAPYLPVEERLGLAMAQVGGSMTVASISEALAFMLGMLTGMPAVQCFSFYSSLAIFFDFLLQITAFAALLSIDARRVKANRVDCLPCYTAHQEDPQHDGSIRGLSKNDFEGRAPSEGLLKGFFRRHYAHWILNPASKTIIVFVFVGFFFVCCSFFVELPLGLMQQVALPKDSYLQDYFDSLTMLAIGPPIYVVIKGGVNYTDVTIQNKLCSNPGCDPQSIVNIYDAAPYVEGTTYSWLDDYLTWSDSSACCTYNVTDGNKIRCPYNATTCQPCFPEHIGQYKDRPTPDDFYPYIPWFYTSEADPSFCPLTGQAYFEDIVWKDGIEGGEIEASRLRLYHEPLITQEDYINALKVVYEISDGAPVDSFPYSVFYVYFEQYLHIVNVAVLDSGLALLGVFIVSFLLLGNPVIAFIIVAAVFMIEIDLLGIMTMWNVDLNAVSVVNLVMGIGISIEFCVHVAHSFLKAPFGEGELNERAHFALTEMGSSVFTGIAITKFLGVVILAFSVSEIFEIYYFRMYMSIVILGAFHGLMFLPVVLSLVPSVRFTIRLPFLAGKDENVADEKAPILPKDGTRIDVGKNGRMYMSH